MKIKVHRTVEDMIRGTSSMTFAEYLEIIRAEDRKNVEEVITLLRNYAIENLAIGGSSPRSSSYKDIDVLVHDKLTKDETTRLLKIINANGAIITGVRGRGTYVEADTVGSYIFNYKGTSIDLSFKV